MSVVRIAATKTGEIALSANQWLVRIGVETQAGVRRGIVTPGLLAGSPMFFLIVRGSKSQTAEARLLY
jgi:hypothetical protein